MLSLVERIEQIRRKAQASAEASPAQAQTAHVIQLPLWPETTRGVPNSVLRSALFGAVRRGRRRYMTREQIASVEGLRIFQTGPRLDQADLDVWEQSLHLAREQLGKRIEFSAYAFLQAIGRHHGKSDREWLKASLLRLMSAVVEIEDGRRAYAGHLIDHWYRDDATGRHVIEINPKIAALYNSDGWTAIEWSQRLALTSQLSKWLHGFYSTHAAPYPMKVETLHRLCGSEASSMRHFREELRSSLDELERVAGWRWRIDEHDMVHVDRRPSPSQSRHLIRKGRKG